MNLRTEIKVSPLPTAVHPQQIWQSAPIVWPWPITDNGSPPEPPPRRPNWLYTHSSKERCSSLMNTHDRTCQPSRSVTASHRLGATCEVCPPLWLLFGPRIILSPVTVISLFHCNCVLVMRQESTELQRKKTLAKFRGVPSSRLIFLLKQQCAGFGFHLSFFSHFAGKSSTHLWPLITLNSALFHSVTQQSHRLAQSQMWCHWPTLCFLFPNLKENRTWMM